MRIRVRQMLAAVAILALILGALMGLKRRSERLFRVSRAYSGQAGRLEHRLIPSNATSEPYPSDAEAAVIIRMVHWYDSVAAQYQIASNHPWRLTDPDPDGIVSGCSCHRGMSHAEAFRLP